MNTDIKQQSEPQKAVIYCRVSSKSQLQGSGLDSQEHRCREYAKERGYSVEAVFPDDVSGGGDFMNRKGMVALLNFLDDNPFENYVVVFDDLKRYARDTEFHLKLKREMEVRGARRDCLNFRFEDTPESKFVETVLAAQGELEREQNRRQVLQKMKARVEQGYWVKKAPRGYLYEKAKGGGKVLVRDPALFSIVQNVLEGFASGRFGSQAEVKRHLESQPIYPKDTPTGLVRQQSVVRLLRRPVYAGMVYAPKWGVSMREGKHEAMISMATHNRIKDILERGVYAPSRADTRPDFILRGAVCCDGCSKPLTAGYSKGKMGKRYAYYWCQQKGCDQRSKTIPRDKLEGEFAALLKSVQPAPSLLKVAIAMLTELWDRQSRDASSRMAIYQEQVASADAEIAKLVDRFVDTTNPRLIAAIENRIEEHERVKLAAEQKLAEGGGPLMPIENVIKLSLKYLSAPYTLWESGRSDLQRLVLKLTFAGHLRYRKGDGIKLPELSLPFNLFKHLGGNMSALTPAFAGNCEMVPRGRIELPTSSLPIMTTALLLLNFGFCARCMNTVQSARTNRVEIRT
ncbi:MAG: recombinase family protein [Pseudomonadota bacterium]